MKGSSPSDVLVYDVVDPEPGLGANDAVRTEPLRSLEPLDGPERARPEVAVHRGAVAGTGEEVLPVTNEVSLCSLPQQRVIGERAARPRRNLDLPPPRGRVALAEAWMDT